MQEKKILNMMFNEFKGKLRYHLIEGACYKAGVAVAFGLLYPELEQCVFLYNSPKSDQKTLKKELVASFNRYEKSIMQKVQDVRKNQDLEERKKCILDLMRSVKFVSAMGIAFAFESLRENDRDFFIYEYRNTYPEMTFDRLVQLYGKEVGEQQAEYEAVQICSSAITEAEQFLEEHWDLVDKLFSALLCKGFLSHKMIQELIQNEKFNEPFPEYTMQEILGGIEEGLRRNQMIMWPN